MYLKKRIQKQSQPEQTGLTCLIQFQTDCIRCVDIYARTKTINLRFCNLACRTSRTHILGLYQKKKQTKGLQRF